MHGVSLVEYAGPRKGTRVIEAFQLGGRARTDPQGLRRAEFTLSERPGVTTLSSVTVLRRGAILAGETVSDGIPYQGREVSVRYRWTAEKVMAGH